MQAFREHWIMYIGVSCCSAPKHYLMNFHEGTMTIDDEYFRVLTGWVQTMILSFSSFLRKWSTGVKVFITRRSVLDFSEFFVNTGPEEPFYYYYYPDRGSSGWETAVRWQWSTSPFLCDKAENSNCTQPSQLSRSWTYLKAAHWLCKANFLRDSFCPFSTGDTESTL